MASNPSFVATLATPAVSFANADGTSFKTVMTAGAAGSRLDTLFGTNSDPAVATVMQLAVQVGGTDYEIGEVTIPAGAGTNGSTKSVALLNTTDLPGLLYTEGGALYLASGVLLRARPKVAVAVTFAIKLVGIGGNY